MDKGYLQSQRETGPSDAGFVRARSGNTQRTGGGGADRRALALFFGLRIRDGARFVTAAAGRSFHEQFSNCAAPSVDGEFCAVNETGTIRRQEDNGLGNLVRCSRTARWRLCG
jgi:hypothetical protein